MQAWPSIYQRGESLLTTYPVATSDRSLSLALTLGLGQIAPGQQHVVHRDLGLVHILRRLQEHDL